MTDTTSQTVDLTTEEVVALCDGLGLSPVDVLREDAPSETTDPGEAVRRGLFARGVVQLVDDKPVVDTELAHAFHVAAYPELLSRVAIEINEERGFVHLAAEPELAVERRLVAPGIHRWLVFPGEEVFLRLRDVSGLDSPTPVPPVPPMTVTFQALATSGELLLTGDESAASEALHTEGTSEATIKAYIEALKAKQRSVAVTVLTREGDSVVHGSLTTWMDAGAAGRWRLTTSNSVALSDPEASEAEIWDSEVTLTPVSAEDLLREIFEGLPTAD